MILALVEMKESCKIRAKSLGRMGVGLQIEGFCVTWDEETQSGKNARQLFQKDQNDRI
jgi:hypothetical protein